MFTPVSQSRHSQPLVTGRAALTPRPTVDSETEALALNLLFGDSFEVDRVGTFLLVHRDSPTPQLRRARVEDLRTRFDPTRYEEDRDLVNRGAIYVWNSPSHDPRIIRGHASRAPRC